jgi:hypothetical protein
MTSPNTTHPAGWVGCRTGERTTAATFAPYALRKAALTQGDTFMYARWQEHERAAAESRRLRQQTGSLTLAALTLALVDYAAAGLLGAPVVSILRSFEQGFGRLGVAMLVGLAVVAILALHWAWFGRTRDEDWLYYPALEQAPRAQGERP